MSKPKPTVVDDAAGAGESRNGPVPPAYPIGSVDSALRLIMLVVERRRLRLADAARELGVARSTAHRLMQMLEYRGFVARDADSRSFTPGPVLMNLGLQAIGNLDVVAVARPHLERLVAEVGETVHMLTFHGTELACIESIESPQALRIGGRQGMRLPTHGSSAGRALLALLPPDKLRGLYPSLRLPEVPRVKLATRSDLEHELVAVRERGYAVQSDETEAGVSAVGVAIADRLGHPAFGLAVAIPTSRVVEQDIPDVAAAAQRCARTISAALPV